MLRRLILSAGLMILISGIVVESLQAQILTPPPQDIIPLPRPTTTPQTPELLPPTEELLQEPPTTTPTPEIIPGKIPQAIAVSRFDVVGSTVFSPEDFAGITKPFTGRPITLSELFQVRTLVAELYQQRGYITSGAYIPPQRLRDSVVTIQVVEGSLEDIKVIGTKHLNPNYIRSRIAVAASKPLNRDRLLEALQLLQLNPLIQNLSAELSAGVRPGESLLEVSVIEADTSGITTILDNGRSPSVGSFRRRIQFDEANLLGLGDDFNLTLSNTDGSDTLDLSYTLSVNPRNGTLNFSYGTSSSDVIEPPFNALDINSHSRYYQISFRQPIVETPTEEFALGLTASRQESQAFLLETIPFPVLGADEEGRTRVSALRFFQQWTKRSSQQVLALQSQFSVGLDAFNSTINETAPDSRFFAWRGQAQWVRLLAPETLLILRTDIQLADRALVPLEQISLGGFESVRGYRQDFLLTDNGAFASAEVRVPILRLPQISSVLQLTPFVDVGTGWNRSGRPDPEPNTLAAVGLGLRWQTADNLTARIEWGIPLVSVDSGDRTWQENGVYFSIIYNPLF